MYLYPAVDVGQCGLLADSIKDGEPDEAGVAVGRLPVLGGHLLLHHTSPRVQPACTKQPLAVRSQKTDKYRREGKGRHCWLGDVLECRTNYFVARMI